MVTLTIDKQAAWTNALNLVRHESVRTWILVCSSALSEAWCTCSLAKAFSEVHGGPVTLVMKDSQKDIALMFQKDVFKILHAPDNVIGYICESILGIGSFDIDQPIVAQTFWHGTGRGAEELMELMSYPNRGGLSLADHFRYLLRVGWDAPMQEPTIPPEWRMEAEMYAESIGLEPYRSVILLPDTNTNPPLPEEFWIRIAKELVDRKYKVFTNMAGNGLGPRTAPLPGTQPITLTVRMAVLLAERAVRFIGSSTGLMAVLLGRKADAEHTVLLHDPSPGVTFNIRHYQVKRPVFIQTQRATGINTGPVHEYAVRPGEYSDKLIDDIITNNPNSAYDAYASEAGLVG